MASELAQFGYTGGQQTWTAPATLIGDISCDVCGSWGATAGANSGAAGYGGQLSGNLSTSPGSTFYIWVGAGNGFGYHAGGPGGTGASGISYGGGYGGGSTALLDTYKNMLIESGGGGGGGGAAGAGGVPNNGGAGGSGGNAPSNGSPGQNVSYGGNAGAGGGTGFTAGAYYNGSYASQELGGNGEAAGNSTGGGGGGGGGGSLVGQGGKGGGDNSAGGGGGGGSSAWNSVVSIYYNVSGTWSGNGLVNIRYTVADAPLAPTVNGPANGVAFDGAITSETFSWTYNPQTNSGNEAAYCLKFSRSDGSVLYYNATSRALQSAQVWNSSGSTSVTLAAGVFINGYTYTWSVATAEAYYNLEGPFSSTRTFSATASPVVTVSVGGSTVQTTTPTVSWSTVFGSGASQVSWSVVVYTSAQYGAAGFSPGTSSGASSSGTVSSAATSWLVNPPLTLGLYRAYVQVTETGGIASAWSYTQFSVTPVPQYSGMSLEVQTSSDLLTVGVGWTPGYITAVSAALPTSVSSQAISTFTKVSGVRFATQQSPPIQVIPFDTFDNPAFYSTYLFPLDTNTGFAAVNDFKTTGNAVATYLANSSGVLVTQSPDVTPAASHSTIQILPAPVLAEGGPTITQSGSGGLVSPAVSVSGGGNVYPAVRFTAVNDMTAYLQVRNAATLQVLVEWPIAAVAGQTIQFYQPYEVGSQAPAGTQLQVALVAEGNTNTFKLSALSMFDEGIGWAFSIDGGVTFVTALGIRNNPYGMVRFPVAGTQLVWQATFYRQDRYINRLRLRPQYVVNQQRSASVPFQGPTPRSSDPSVSILTDPLFSGYQPIPSTWFTGAVTAS
jgi:hypothetical protein